MNKCKVCAGLCIFIKATLASQILQDEVQEEGDVVEERVMRQAS